MYFSGFSHWKNSVIEKFSIKKIRLTFSEVSFSSMPSYPLKISFGFETARKKMFLIRVSAETFQALMTDFRYLGNEIYNYYGENFLNVIYIYLLKITRILFKNWIQMKTWTELFHNRFRITMENLTIPAMLQVNHRNSKIFLLNPLLIRKSSIHII